MSPKYCNRRLAAAVLCLAAATGFAGVAVSAVGDRVTLSIVGERLQTAVPRMGRAADVSSRCGDKAANRRIYLVAENQPLPLVLRQLRQTMACPPGKAWWFRSGSGFIFDEDIASWEARRKAVRKKYAERLEAGRKALDEVEKWAGFGREGFPEDLEAAKAYLKKHKVQPLDRWNMGMWVKVVRSLPRDLQDKGLLGLTTRVPVSQLPAATLNALYAVRHTSPWRDQKSENAAQRRSSTAHLRKQVLILGRQQGAPQRLPSLALRLQTPPAMGGSTSREPLHVPLGADEGGSPNFMAAYRAKLKEQGELEQRGPDGMENIPALQKSIRLPAKDDGDAIAERLLPAISKAAGRPLIGEFDPCVMQPLFSDERSPISAIRTLSRADRPMPIHEMLEMVCRELDLYWDYKDGWIVITSPRREFGWAGWLDLSPTLTKDR